MTTTIERAEAFAAVLSDARAARRKQPGDGVTAYWVADMLDEGSAWIKANADILPPEVDASWQQMDNGPMLVLRARNVDDVADLLDAAFALSDRFGVGVLTYQPSQLGTIAVSVERISMDGYRAGALRIDFSGSARMAVAS